MEQSVKQNLIDGIRSADMDIIDELLHEVMGRKRQLYPDWDIWYHAFEKENAAQVDLKIRKVLEAYQNGDNEK